MHNIPHIPTDPTPETRADGFTLMEILISVILLGLAFTAIMAMLSTGAVSLRRSKEDVEGHLGALNAVELLKGQSLTRCDMEYPWSHTDTPRSYLNELLASGMCDASPTVPGGCWDVEVQGMLGYNNSVYINGTWQNRGNFLRYLPWSLSDWKTMYNISDNGVIRSISSDAKCGGGYPVWLADGADTTDFTRGRIRGLHQRTADWLRIYRGDFSYPAFVSDPENRNIHVGLVISDQAFDAAFPTFKIVAMSARKHADDSWPEMNNWISTPWSRCVNMWDRNMIATGVNDNNSCGGLYDGAGPGFPTTFYWYGSRNQSLSSNPSTRPGAYRIAATMYDQANSEVTIAYPDGGNFPPSSYSGGNSTAVSWSDPSRRIGVGDTIVSGDTGDVFYVQAVRDHPRTDRVKGNAMIQILTVYPPLKTTALRPSTVDPWAAPYYMSNFLFVPRPNNGGDSPLVGVEILNANDIMRFDRFN